jgi:hypothetical protein
MRLSKNVIGLVVLCAAIVVGMMLPLREYFTSPGTMVQLASTHVPTADDIYYDTHVYPGVVRREIAEMTGEDPGPIRPWIFPVGGYYILV